MRERINTMTQAFRDVRTIAFLLHCRKRPWLESWLVAWLIRVRKWQLTLD